jgi:outer membrane biosynthesis protein TonB
MRLTGFKNAPVQFCITYFVIFCHLLFFAHLGLKKKETTFKTLPQRIVVRTTSSAPPPLQLKPTTVEKPVTAQLLPTVTAPKASPATPKPKAKPKRATPTKKTNAIPIKKENPPIPKELVQKLEESIAKIDKKPDNYRGKEAFVLPERIKSSAHLDTSRSLATQPSDFLIEVKGELIQQLQSSLHLPDFGEVKVQLKLSESGKVENVKVLKAASQKNHEYLIKELPLMSFPSLSLHRLPEKERVFVITFHNEISR